VMGRCKECNIVDADNGYQWCYWCVELTRILAAKEW